jgi:alpha-L-fucosidase
MDQSFGFNRNSDESHFLDRDELIGMVGDIASTGGNLLLNVGPRGEDATIPDEQVRRLDWLADWTSGPGAVVHASRPWVRPATTTASGTRLRFLASDTRVWVLPEGTVDGELDLPGVAPTPATTVSAVGGGLRDWDHHGGLLRVRLPGDLHHGVIELDRVDAVPL